MRLMIFIAMYLFVKQVFAFQAVDINHASVEQIALLPGVGKKLAENVVTLRKKRGSFSEIKQLSLVVGMTTQKIEQIKPHVIFGASKKNMPEPALIVLPKKSIVELNVLEQAALKTFNLTNDFDQSLSNRARKSAWLPKFSTLFDVENGHMNAEKRMGGMKDSVLSRGDYQFGFGVRAIFDFDKLIFNREELEVAKLFLKRQEKREEIITKLHKNYFLYLRLAESLGIPLEKTTAQALIFEMKETEAVLDAMTNGEFSRFFRGEG